MKTWIAEIWRKPLGGSTWEKITETEIEARTESSAMNKAEKMTNPYRRVYIKGQKETK